MFFPAGSDVIHFPPRCNECVIFLCFWISLFFLVTISSIKIYKIKGFPNGFQYFSSFQNEVAQKNKKHVV